MTPEEQTVDSYNRKAENYNSTQPYSFYHKYLEKPAIFSLVPDLKGKKVLCIGVGTGQEANELTLKGAEVVGIDISEGMINIAKKNYPKIEFKVMDMNKLDFTEESFDFVFSSLTLHYSSKPNELFEGIYKLLKPHGILLFSTTHPIFNTSVKFQQDNKRFDVIGNTRELESKKVESLGEYFKEEQKVMDLGDDFIVNFYHRTISTWINSVIESGFAVKKFIEPQPLIESKELFPEKFRLYSNRPGFIVMLCEKLSL